LRDKFPNPVKNLTHSNRHRNTETANKTILGAAPIDFHSKLSLNGVMAEKILVVEDQPLIRRCICEALKRRGGYEVDEAGDGAEALELIKARRFDLVISDLMIPKLDGLKLVNEVRSVSPQTGVLVMTGYLSKKSAKQSLAGIEFVTKPFGFDDLLATVQRVLHGNLS
jgi:DNA-binding NtrC family response regulator